METHDQPCRDVHGMEVSRDHKELLDMYSPVWEQEEVARCDNWQQFLTRAAVALLELGVLPAGRTEPTEQSAILQALLANRPRLPPQLVKELGQLVSSGIPRPLRGLAWQQLLGGPQAFPEHYYESLLFSMQEHCPIVSPLQLVPPGLAPPQPRCAIPADKLEAWAKSARTWLLQISKDTQRTFPGHDRMAGEGATALGRVLAAFTLHAPDMGYCQGMNFVAGSLLLVGAGGEAGAFASLVGVAGALLPGYYAPVMVAPQVDQVVFRELVGQHFPALSAHLEAGLGCEVGAPLPGWLLSGWVNWLPFEAAARLWDVAAWEGSGAVFMRAALALLHLYGGALGGAGDALDASVLLHAMPGMTFDAERLLGVAQGCYSEVSPEVLQSLQDIARINMAAASQLEADAAEGGPATTTTSTSTSTAPPPPPAAAAAAGAEGLQPPVAPGAGVHVPTVDTSSCSTAAGVAAGPPLEAMPTADGGGVTAAGSSLGVEPSVQGTGSGTMAMQAGRGVEMGAGEGERQCSSGEGCQGGSVEPATSAAAAVAPGGACDGAAEAAPCSTGQAGPAAEGCEVDNGWVPDFATPAADPTPAPWAAAAGVASYNTTLASSSSSSNSVSQLYGQQPRQQQGQPLPSSSSSSSVRGAAAPLQGNRQPPGSPPVSPGDDEDEEGEDECSGLLLPSDSSGSAGRRHSGSGSRQARPGRGGLGALAASWVRGAPSSDGSSTAAAAGHPQQRQQQQQQQQGGRAADGSGEGGNGGGGGIARERYKVLVKEKARSKAVAEAYAIALTPGLIPRSRGPSAAGAPSALHHPAAAAAATAVPAPPGLPASQQQHHPAAAGGAGSQGSGSGGVAGGGQGAGAAKEMLRVRASEDEWVDLGCLGAGAASPAGAAGGGGGGVMCRQAAGPGVAVAGAGDGAGSSCGTSHAHQSQKNHHHHHQHQHHTQQQQQQEGLPGVREGAWPPDMEQRYGLDAMRGAWAAATAAAAALEAGDTGPSPGTGDGSDAAGAPGPARGGCSSASSLLADAVQGVRRERGSLGGAGAPYALSSTASAAMIGSLDSRSGSFTLTTPSAAAAAAGGSGDGAVTPALPSGLSTPGGMSRTASVAIAAAREAACWLSQELLAGPSPRQQQEQEEAGQEQQQVGVSSVSEGVSSSPGDAAASSRSTNTSGSSSGGVLTLKQHARAMAPATAAAVRGPSSPLGSPRTRLGSSGGAPASVWSNSSGLVSPSGTGSARGGGPGTSGGYQGAGAVLSQLMGAVGALEAEVVAAAAAQAAGAARARAVLHQYEAVMGAAWDKVGVLLAALAAREGEVGALQQQLMQESRRLEQQDEELAAKDELIAAMQARLSGALPASHHHNHHNHHQQHHHQQQQQGRSRGPSFAGGFLQGGGGGNSGGGGGGSPGAGGSSREGEAAAGGVGRSITAAIAARFSSPTKAPQQQQQQQQLEEGEPQLAGGEGQEAAAAAAAAAAAPTWRQRLLPLRKTREVVAAGGGLGSSSSCSGAAPPEHSGTSEG